MNRADRAHAIIVLNAHFARDVNKLFGFYSDEHIGIIIARDADWVNEMNIGKRNSRNGNVFTRPMFKGVIINGQGGKGFMLKLETVICGFYFVECKIGIVASIEGGSLDNVVTTHFVIKADKLGTARASDQSDPRITSILAKETSNNFCWACRGGKGRRKQGDLL